jgi:hypothetical protein
MERGEILFIAPFLYHPGRETMQSQYRFSAASLVASSCIPTFSLAIDALFFGETHEFGRNDGCMNSSDEFVGNGGRAWQM